MMGVVGSCCLISYAYVKCHCILLADLTDLVEDLGPCAAQWDMLGIMLNLEGEKLDAIEGESNRVSKCLRKVLEEWFKTQCSPNTKEQLLKVLRTKAMGPQEVLAKEIEDNKGMHVLTGHYTTFLIM